MPNWLRFPLTLAVLAAVAGGGLAFVEVATEERVRANRKRKLNAAFKQVPGYQDNRELKKPKDLGKKYTKEEKCFELFDRPVEEVEKAGKGGKRVAPIAYAAQVKCTDPPCYNGADPIVLVVVMGKDLKKVLLVRSTQNKETPGLGTRVSQKAPRKSLASMAGLEEVTPPERDYEFLDKFRDRAAAGLEINKDGLDGISGATVSSNAVVGGVRKAVAFLSEVTGR